ncbi:hypothetical protein [Kitasatospora phosalacinea]|uniref:hypothetical protein n=1 Tax=Kitasatospora phosalacinea TaxID=2065 RepID=UPI00255244C2|nr:hypothetical protein [Kitasatospora phosalacinea]
MPDIFRTVLEAEKAQDAVGIFLEGHLEVEGNLFEASVPAVGVILAALCGELSDYARSQLLQTLWVLSCGESHHSEVLHGRSRLGDECRLRAREGIWLVAAEGFGRNRELAADILEVVDLNEDRASYYARTFPSKRRAK